MNYCTNCDKEFTNLDKHLNSEEHKKNSVNEHERIMKKIGKRMKSINPYEYYRNIKKYHDGKIPKERNNKGNKLCPLCKVKAGNLYRQSFSALHRHNVLKKSNEKKATLKAYKKHSDKYNSKDIYELNE